MFTALVQCVITAFHCYCHVMSACHQPVNRCLHVGSCHSGSVQLKTAVFKCISAYTG